MLFEKIFIARPWKFLFVSSDDLISEWRQRWSIDRYSFLFGMSFALIICLLKRVNLVDEFENNTSNMNGSIGNSDHGEDSLDIREINKRNRASSTGGQLSLKIKSILCLLSIGGIVFYYFFAVLCTSKESCDSYTTFVTIIPVI